MRNFTKIEKLTSLTPVAIFLLLWEAAGHFAHTPLFPPLSKVLNEFYQLTIDGTILKNLGASFFRVLSGYILGSVLGIIAGILMSTNRIFKKSLSPIISMFLPIPTLGWLPLLMLWIGINEALPITLIFICAFFPVAYNTYTGIDGVRPGYAKVAKTLGASRWFILRRVMLPMAAPNIFTGLRLESGMVWRTVIAAEMFAIPTGVGAMLFNAESIIRVDIIMCCLIALSLMCTLFERTLIWAEDMITSAWR
ncbi:MAG: ABC transporter permease [Nitrospirae bacterium]|nr:ABC transporter permease [Nitrospirota bacterium]